MGFIGTLIIGLIAGALAKLLMPGRQGGGIIVTMLLGIVGAFLATWLGQALGWYGPNEGAGLIGAVVGAIIVLLIYGAVTRRRA
ncbi:GlsB/YeaQ/YmgE family stress response membrane protein [Rubellimicrobium rubrum]|uniref:GlsB/YeaQ/YmgE family stress response membrane protein n=1 Tax=Rubellimicrobium rubrum TaxID=2585369 RepID=A0A5C4N6A3_9RHOB|nr:GlsB/YeaQ/YmgE family stress response membrane protein [Rubellimicrobium rubrum]TNC52484.1 GlsB/YeaQ/YmgE family stress response membrane protein [Rubellimicrobium rubrum]